jgi:hypothetical protein
MEVEKRSLKDWTSGDEESKKLKKINIVVINFFFNFSLEKKKKRYFTFF